MAELTSKEEQKIKELAVDYFEETLGLPSTPSSADIAELVEQMARELLKRPMHRRGPFIITDDELRALALPDSKPDNQGGA